MNHIIHLLVIAREDVVVSVMFSADNKNSNYQKLVAKKLSSVWKVYLFIFCVAHA